MKIPKIKIRYSKPFEIKRIFESVKKLNWYRKNKYHIFLPRQVLKKQNLSKKDIGDVLNIGYRQDQYKIKRKKIYDWWQKNRLEILKIFEGLNNCKAKIFPYYIVWITRYGTGGSYNPPQKIIINISKKRLTKIYSIIIHEIIHLGIENLITKHKIPHFSKERLVDLLMEKTAPNFYFKQPLPLEKDVKIIDKSWNKGEKKIPLVIKRFLKFKKLN